ncbi:MAG TPA: hypothetical protein VK700_20910 [Steroidobacteraceae bacterium]|jgi:tetratricopeptide (TPR) repeat protein|nr:hypothetical protein [Steroidobacteraceae bacterium]
MNKVAKFAVAGAMAMVLGNSIAAFADDAAPPPATPKPGVSAAAGKDLQAAQKALADKNYDVALAALDKVKANPKKNEYDEFAMNQFYYNAYVAQHKLQEAEQPLEAWLNSKYITPDLQKKLVVAAAYLNYQLMNYDKALEFGNRAVKEGYAPAQLQQAMAQAYYLKNDYRGTDRFVRAMVDDQVKAGSAPTEDMLKLGLSSAVKLNDDNGESRWLELLVTYHPTPDYWQNLLDSVYRTNSKMSDPELLQVYRLSADVGALKKGSEYAEMAQLALARGSPGEAVAVLNKGFAANAFTEQADKNRNTHLLDSAKKQAATDQPTLAKSEAEAANAPNGDRFVGAGIGYFGYGDYDKATKDISAGLAKGTVKDPPDARLTLGIAQLKAGNKDEAVKTFKAVKGDPVDERIAALWILHARSGQS